MTKKAIILFFAICSVASFNLFSQEVDETPQHFGQFYNNPMLNIARNGLDSKLEISLDNQRNVGGFSGVSTSCFSLFYNLDYQNRSSPKVASKNVFGVYFYNDREGDFISRNRIQFIFTRHQKISKDWHLSLGVSGGIYLFGVKPTTSTRAYSANTFEGNSSLLLYSEKFQVGLSMNQFTNNTIQPVFETTRLKRHYYFFSQYKWRAYKVDLITSVFIKYMNANNPLYYTRSVEGGASFKAIYGIVMAGIIADNYGVYLTMGLNNWEFSNYKLGIDFSYFVPTAGTNINVNRMELNLRMKFLGRKEVTF